MSFGFIVGSAFWIKWGYTKQKLK